MRPHQARRLGGEALRHRVADQQHLRPGKDVRQLTGAGRRRTARSRPAAGGREVGVEDPNPGVDVVHERQIPPQDRSYDRNVDLVHIGQSMPGGTLMGDHELDVRPLRKPDKHPAIFQAYAAVPPGEALVLVNDHDPRHLRDEFEVEHPGGYAWDYLATDRGAWRIRITKLASTPL